ncbi:MAG TPA: hypothetical protein PKC97_05480 [Burkholderiaceae bacterium]|nr:hypothetical protein [Burkholderiaceae bacterium]
MGHTERIVAELATLDETEKARLLAFVHELKAARTLGAKQQGDRATLSAALAPYRVALAGFRFDREEANAR